MRVLVLGGAGFLGRHVVAELLARGADVVVGTRHPARATARLPECARECERRRLRFERATDPDAWKSAIAGIDAVVNCVGILRPRGPETYDRIHHLAPAALAAACARRHVRRLIHVSALGLREEARSGFIRSKLDGERAIIASDAAWTIVRPSLLDGEGGFGARWIRGFARAPVHFVPADAIGRIAMLDVRDAAAAIVALCVDDASAYPREVEIGGGEARTMAEILAAERAATGRTPARCIRLPALLARAASHVCDALHFSPFSFGHFELLRHDNVPRPNLLPVLLTSARAVPEQCQSSATPGSGPVLTPVYCATAVL